MNLRALLCAVILSLGLSISALAQIAGALGNGGPASGDLAGNFPSPTVAAINNGGNVLSGVYAATVNAPGIGATPGDIVTPTGGTTSILAGYLATAQIVITDTQAVSGTVAAAGSGGTNGACTVTGTTGTGTKAQYTGTVSGNVLTGPLTVAVAGDYTANPTARTVEPVTGCGLTGAQVNMVLGALFLYVPQSQTGSYSSVPSLTANPQATTTGTGTGLTMNLTTLPLATGVPAPAQTGGGASHENFVCPGSFKALGLITTGVEDTACGWNSLAAATTLSNSTGIGVNSGGSWATGANNFFGGTDAGRNGTGGSGMVAVGSGALKTYNQSGANNITAVGSGAVGTWNGNNAAANLAAFGENACNGASGSTFRGITCIGVNAFAAGSSATSGTYIGMNAGSATCASGAANIMIASGAQTVDCAAGTDTAIINIENVWKATGTGTPSTSASTVAGSLTVAGIASAAQADVVCTTSAGLLSFQVSATGCASSSERFKNMLSSLSDPEKERIALCLTEAKRWTYKDPDFGDPSEYVGFTAEQVAACDDRFITRDADGLPYAVKHQQLAEVAIAGFGLLFQGLKVEIEALRGRVQ